MNGPCELCDNGLVEAPVPGGKKHFRCPCPKGDRWKRIESTVKLGRRKRVLVTEVPLYPPAAPDYVPVISKLSGRDRAAGNHEGEA